MKYNKLLLWVAVCISALGAQAFASWAVQQGSAQIFADELASDWCQHRVILGGQEYALDSHSYALVNNAFLKASIPPSAFRLASVRQQITYVKTNNEGTVMCGRGFDKKLPEIRIISFIPKSYYATAVLQPNKIPADGCDHTVTIKWQSYALDAQSRDSVSNLYASNFPDPQMSYTRKIQYSLTGKEWTVQCGRGSNKTLPEVKLIGIYQ
jgi:hypothetical protein